MHGIAVGGKVFAIGELDARLTVRQAHNVLHNALAEGLRADERGVDPALSGIVLEGGSKKLTARSGIAVRENDHGLA